MRPASGVSVLLGLAPLVAAAAPASPPPVVRTITTLEAAQLLMQAGKVAEAKTVLLALEKTQPDDNEVQFLLGLIAVAETDYPAAIHRFRGILVRDPKAERVRLELARAFFLAKDYDNAERQFRFARAGDLPAPVMANVDRYLQAIREARRLTFNLSVALAPDTNLNAGPTVATVDIYGLPFELSSDARKRSGVGATVDAGAEWSPPIARNVRLRLGGQVHRTDYSGSEFDDMTVAGYAGPRFLGRRWDISPLLTGFERWYGAQFYNRGLGGSLQAVFYPSARLGLSGVIGAQRVDYAPPVEQGGPAISGALGAAFVLNPASTLSGSVSVTRQNAAEAAYANTASQVQLGYARDLPHGYSVSLEPSYVRVDYDAAVPAFGVARHDRQWAMRVTVLNRRIDIAGFTPRLAYTYTHNASDIALYAYDRNRVEVGLTRVF